MIGVLAKKGYTWNRSISDCECHKECKTVEYLVIKNSSCKRCLFGKLVSASEDEILNTTEVASIVDNKLAYEKTSCFIHAISFITICLFLLVAISVNC